ncbi:phospholipase A [Thalassotalea fusca]
MTFNKSSLALLIASAVALPVTHAQEAQLDNDCVIEKVSSMDENTSIAEIRMLCQVVDSASVERKPTKHSKGPISERMLKERRTAFDPYVITPHRMNYVLPVLTTNQINKAAYDHVEGYADNLVDIESKFQLSLKAPLNHRDIFTRGDALMFAFTLEAWWQVYSDNISKPFRETNYRPELFYLSPLQWHPFEGNTGFVLGVEHQSNGRSQLLSRSWNRVYAGFLFEKGDFALSFKPWIRINEDEKEHPLDPDGDDNPDIDHYMGHFQLGMVYKVDDYEFSLGGRQNFGEHHGSLELGFTFPLWGKLRGYATAFTGYGESMIDYNYKQTRFGIGIALNNVL